MPEIQILDNGELRNATEITLILTDDVVAEIRRLAEDGDELAVILWTSIELDHNHEDGCAIE